MRPPIRALYAASRSGEWVSVLVAGEPAPVVGRVTSIGRRRVVIATTDRARQRLAFSYAEILDVAIIGAATVGQTGELA